MKDKRFTLVNIALVIGLIAFLGGLAQLSGLLSGGLYMLIGGLVYKSAKKRRLKLVLSSTKRITIELIGVAIIFVMILLTNKTYLIEDPFPYLVIPLWAIIAYIVINIKKEKIKDNNLSESK